MDKNNYEYYITASMATERIAFVLKAKRPLVKFFINITRELNQLGPALSVLQ